MNTFTSPALASHYADDRETIATAPAVREELLALGIASLRAQYDGAGDEGQIDDVRYFSDAEQTVDIAVDHDLRQQVESLLYALLNCRHGGWDQNDGAFGHFQWELDADLFEHEHNDRYVTHITSNQMGFELTVVREELP